MNFQPSDEISIAMFESFMNDITDKAEHGDNVKIKKSGYTEMQEARNILNYATENDIIFMVYRKNFRHPTNKKNLF